MDTFVLDASAVVALLKNEDGADVSFTYSVVLNAVLLQL
jgi:PIN domain nuclease of toxin-antitoxin system